MYVYVEGEAWQEPLQENRDYLVMNAHYRTLQTAFELSSLQMLKWTQILF